MASIYDYYRPGQNSGPLNAAGFYIDPHGTGRMPVYTSGARPSGVDPGATEWWMGTDAYGNPTGQWNYDFNPVGGGSTAPATPQGGAASAAPVTSHRGGGAPGRGLGPGDNAILSGGSSPMVNYNARPDPFTGPAWPQQALPGYRPSLNPLSSYGGGGGQQNPFAMLMQLYSMMGRFGGGGFGGGYPGYAGGGYGGFPGGQNPGYGNFNGYGYNNYMNPLQMLMQMYMGNWGGFGRGYGLPMRNRGFSGPITPWSQWSQTQPGQNNLVPGGNASAVGGANHRVPLR